MMVNWIKYFYASLVLISMVSPNAFCSKQALEDWEQVLLEKQASISKMQEDLKSGVQIGLPRVDYQVWEHNKVGGTLLKKSTSIEDKANFVVLPGAFTPTCTGKHIAEYVKEYNNLNSILVKHNIATYVVARNDPDVIAEWAKDRLGVQENSLLFFVPDPRYKFMSVLGALEDNPRLGIIGRRSIYYVEDGKIIAIKRENENKDVCESSLLAALDFWKSKERWEN